MDRISKTFSSKEVRICSDETGFHGCITIYASPETAHFYGTFRSDQGSEFTLVQSPALISLWHEETEFALITGFEADVNSELQTMHIHSFLSLRHLENAGEVACSFQNA